MTERKPLPEYLESGQAKALKLLLQADGILAALLLLLLALALVLSLFRGASSVLLLLISSALSAWNCVITIRCAIGAGALMRGNSLGAGTLGGMLRQRRVLLVISAILSALDLLMSAEKVSGLLIILTLALLCAFAVLMFRYLSGAAEAMETVEADLVSGRIDYLNTGKLSGIAITLGCILAALSVGIAALAWQSATWLTEGLFLLCMLGSVRFFLVADCHRRLKRRAGVAGVAAPGKAEASAARATGFAVLGASLSGVYVMGRLINDVMIFAAYPQLRHLNLLFTALLLVATGLMGFALLHEKRDGLIVICSGFLLLRCLLGLISSLTGATDLRADAFARQVLISQALVNASEMLLYAMFFAAALSAWLNARRGSAGISIALRLAAVMAAALCAAVSIVTYVMYGNFSIAFYMLLRDLPYQIALFAVAFTVGLPSDIRTEGIAQQPDTEQNDSSESP